MIKGEQNMNKRYFKLTKDELWFLIMCQNVDILMEYDGNIEDWDTEKLELCVTTLKQKKYLTLDENNNITINPLLESWMYVVTHPYGYFEAVSSYDEKVLLYFYEESIVSIHVQKDSCELMWLPFIHLAIGQLLQNVGEENYSKWIFLVQDNERNRVSKYIPSKEEVYLDVVKKISNMLIPVHGQSMKVEVV